MLIRIRAITEEQIKDRIKALLRLPIYQGWKCTGYIKKPWGAYIQLERAANSA